MEHADDLLPQVIVSRSDIFILRSLGTPLSEATLPYEKKRFLLTQAEKSFYLVLVQAVPEDHVIFAKVRLSDRLVVKKGAENRQRYLNKITARHVDFLVCDRDRIEPKTCHRTG